MICLAKIYRTLGCSAILENKFVPHFCLLPSAHFLLCFQIRIAPSFLVFTTIFNSQRFDILLGLTVYEKTWQDLYCKLIPT